ncbi:hypothetical protein VIGAN_01340300, partial [Vigna angularis var. angularis]
MLITKITHETRGVKTPTHKRTTYYQRLNSSRNISIKTTPRNCKPVRKGPTAKTKEHQNFTKKQKRTNTSQASKTNLSADKKTPRTICS